MLKYVLASYYKLLWGNLIFALMVLYLAVSSQRAPTSWLLFSPDYSTSLCHMPLSLIAWNQQQ